LTYYKQFQTHCTGGTDCYAMDIDVDQYGNLFVLSEAWGDEHFNQVGVFDQNQTWIQTHELDTSIKTNQDGTELVNMAMDHNGFVYVLDSFKPTQVLIYNSAGTRVKTINIGDYYQDAGNSDFKVKGLGVSDKGDIYFGYSPGTTAKVYKMINNGNFSYTPASSDAFISFPIPSDPFGVFDIDIEISSKNEVVVLNTAKLDYYSQAGTLIKTYQLGGENTNLALGPNDEIYVSEIVDLEPKVKAFSPAGVYQYTLDLSQYELIWDMFVDRLGMLYITTYDAGSVVMYAPQYVANQSAVRQVRTGVNGGFNVRPVKAVNLGS
jgi:hypothetical protein